MPAKLAKVVDEVRLIEIAGGDSNIRPIDCYSRIDAVQDASESG